MEAVLSAAIIERVTVCDLSYAPYMAENVIAENYVLEVHMERVLFRHSSFLFASFALASDMATR